MPFALHLVLVWLLFSGMTHPACDVIRSSSFDHRLPQISSGLFMTQNTLSFVAQVTDLPSLTDSEFLQALAWDRSANASIRAAAAQGNVNAFCKAIQPTLRAVDGGSTSASCGERALWSRQAFPEEVGLADVIGQAAEKSAKKSNSSARRPVNKPVATWAQRVQHLVGELTDAVCSAEPRPFALLAAIEFLSSSGHKLAADQFFKLWRHTLSELLMWPTAIYDDPTVPADVVLVEHGEIPFVGGLVFSQIASANNLVKSGRKLLVRELVDQTDTDGTPHAEILPRLPLWIAPLVRSALMAKRYGVAAWNDEQQQVFTNLIDRAILLCRPDGRAALTNGMQLNSLPVLTAAVEQLDLQLVQSTTNYLQAVHRSVSGKPPRRSRPIIATMPSNQSDWAKFALLRSDWSVEADSVAIAHHQPLPQIDVTALGRSLIHGDWNLKLKLGDAQVELAEEWSCVCWQSDPDADFIELQMQGPGKLRVERLVMLSRKERFLIIADAISGVSAAIAPSADTNGHTRKSGAPKPRIEYESRLSFSPGLIGSSEGTTREARITGKQLKSRVFPLAIPQDRVHSTPHSITIEGNEVVLKQVGEGEGLFAPLVFVWHPERTRVDASWRMLTVAEDGKVVGPDVAVGYRLKLGAYQLLISRSLKKTGNSRTVLGHHTHNETVIASFDSNGDVEPILLVE